MSWLTTMISRALRPKPMARWAQQSGAALAITSLSLGLGQPAQALDDAGVAAKLALVPLLVPTDTSGKPLIINRTQEGKTIPVLFGALSPEAAELLAVQAIAPTSKTKPQFKATNLVAFEEIFNSLRQQQPGLVRAYVPDPQQESAVVGMLLEQGVKAREAIQIARNQPVVFCPEPLIRVNIKRQQSTQVSLPCGLDFREIAVFVLGPRLQNKRPGLAALPLNQFKALLKQLNGSDATGLTVVPSPSMQALLARLMPPAKPTSKSPATSTAPAADGSKPSATPGAQP